MPPRLPSFVKLTRRALDRNDALFAHFVRVLRPSAAEAAFAVQSFAFKNDEQAFARALLRRRTQIWLFRSNQRSFSGDFVAVDMSSPAPERRRALVIDLKRGAPLRTGGGGAGVQLRNAAGVARDVLRTIGSLVPDPGFELVTGDGARILEWIERAPLAAG